MTLNIPNHAQEQLNNAILIKTKIPFYKVQEVLEDGSLNCLKITHGKDCIEVIIEKYEVTFTNHLYFEMLCGNLAINKAEKIYDNFLNAIYEILCEDE